MKPRPGLIQPLPASLGADSAVHDEIVSYANLRVHDQSSRLSAAPLLPLLTPLRKTRYRGCRVDVSKGCRIERESRTVAPLRDALLPKLISGELRVPDAEAFLKARGP
jgi:type I restriction enzyme S subunit